MIKKLSSDYGQIKIHKNTIAQIAEITASQISGVEKVGFLCYGYLGKLLAKILSPFNIRRTGVEITKDVKISIPIVVKYGYNVADVAYQVQKEIAQKIKNYLNIDTSNIDVKIKKVEGR